MVDIEVRLGLAAAVAPHVGNLLCYIENLSLEAVKLLEAFTVHLSEQNYELKCAKAQLSKVRKGGCAA